MFDKRVAWYMYDVEGHIDVNEMNIKPRNLYRLSGRTSEFPIKIIAILRSSLQIGVSIPTVYHFELQLRRLILKWHSDAG